MKQHGQDFSVISTAQHLRVNRIFEGTIIS
jgi:hypothetical protein